ncbi:MAG: hydroxysqualene dehydroxylase HpnE [Methylophilus sp.]|nr:hydroxysqualene dehydroxylase HpnE [Methylophilus sp.]
MPNANSTSHVAIIGGGMAGLAAAATLVNKGVEVTLFEASPYLGGRARGLSYQGTTIDNGQHILLGAYRETLNLLHVAGVDTQQLLKRIPLELLVKDLFHPHTFSLQAHHLLPAPYHILWALMFAKGVNTSEKYAAIQFLAWLKYKKFKLSQDESLLTLLLRKKQSPNFMRFLWEPLCLAAMNTPIQQASAQVFLNVLRDSFAQKKHDADILFATTDLTSLICTPIAKYLSTQGVIIYTNTAVNDIQLTPTGFQITQHDAQSSFSHVILACGPHQLKSFTHALPMLSSLTQAFDYQAITTVYLQYPAEIRLPRPMIGVVNSLTQWIFDRGQLCEQAGLIAVVISAHPHFAQSQAVLAEQVASELTQLFPTLEKPLWHKVITEKRATFSCDAHLVRPANITAYPKLYLAGDYTAGDYPATIEGAIRSGIQAAQLVLINH